MWLLSSAGNNTGSALQPPLLSQCLTRWGERQLNQNMTPVPHQVEENHCFGATVSRIKITKKSCPTSNLPFISQNNLVFPAAVRHHARHRAGWSVPLRSLPLPQVNRLWFCHGSSGEPTKNWIAWNSPKMGAFSFPKTAQTFDFTEEGGGGVLPFKIFSQTIPFFLARSTSVVDESGVFCWWIVCYFDGKLIMIAIVNNSMTAPPPRGLLDLLPCPLTSLNRSI